MMENKTDFEKLYNTNISEFIEKKGKFNYLSWAFAVKELKINYPEATYQQVYNDTKPYFQDESGCYIRIKLWLSKDDRKNDFYQDFTHPILDIQNKSILKPNSFQVNTSFMRGLTKLIGMCTGIGLSLYSGEDLPESSQEDEKEQKKKEFFTKVDLTLKELKASSINFRGYHDYVFNNITSKKEWLINDSRFQAIVKKHEPISEESLNKASQVLNPCVKCGKGINDCKCKIPM